MTEAARSQVPAMDLPPSRRDWLVNLLRREIADGRLEPGSRLIERDLSQRHAVSRGPVREALMILEQEGLVVSSPYRGAEVAGITVEEVTEILVPIRIVIERYAFRMACLAQDATLISTMTAIVEDLTSAAQHGNVTRLADLDIAFHEAVVAWAGQPQGLQIWRTLQPRIRSYFVKDAPLHERFDDIVRQHRLLLDTLVSGDKARLDQAVIDHIQENFESPRS